LSGGDKDPGTPERKSEEATEEVDDYMSAAFIEVSTKKTTVKRRRDPHDDDDEDFVSASLFSTEGQVASRQVDPFSKLDYEEEETAARLEDEEEGEDYMSEGTKDDVKKPVYQGMLKRRADIEAVDSDVQVVPKKLKKLRRKSVVEKQRLREGLGQPINRQSKGYELLSKMGYTPGMALGKKRDEEGEKADERIKEPVAIPTQFISSSRFGLGHKEHGKRDKKAERLLGGLLEKKAPFKEEDFDEQLASYIGRKKEQTKGHDEDSWFD